MQRVAIIILILAVAGGVYFLVNRDDADPGTELTGDGERGKAAKGDVGLDPMEAKGVQPSANPVLLELKSPARALFLGQNNDTWTQTVLMMCGTMRDLSYSSWFLNEGAGSGAAAQGRGMTALADKPTAVYLADEDVTVLVLDGIDPNALPKAFWEAVSSRVNSGRMGLFVRPGPPVGVDGNAASEHPMLSHPTLKALLPIKSAVPMSGSPLPGVFATHQPLKPTSDGLRHPATRLIADPEVSTQAWGAAAQGEGAISTKFCYPVQEAAGSAQILVTCDAATSLPAIIASVPTARARVLWMGNIDFSRKAHFVTLKDTHQKTFINHALVWLVGQSQP